MLHGQRNIKFFHYIKGTLKEAITKPLHSKSEIQGSVMTELHTVHTHSTPIRQYTSNHFTQFTLTAHQTVSTQAIGYSRYTNACFPIFDLHFPHKSTLL
jgi:hypothetical protein